MERTFQVRDGRIKEKFYVDDEYLNGYARHLGTTASMVYIVLCRHADKQQTCFPSMDTIGEKLGVTAKTAQRAVRSLESWNIIKKEQQKRFRNGTWMHNNYLLLDKSEWLTKPQDTSVQRTPEDTGVPNRRTLVSPTGGHSCPPKETHKKEAHKKEANAQQSCARFKSEGAQVIKAFEDVNPNCSRYYGNTTQRGACDNLIDTHGLDKVLKVVAILPKTNREPYIPTITTPRQLEEKWAALEAALIKRKGGSITIKRFSSV